MSESFYKYKFDTGQFVKDDEDNDFEPGFIRVGDTKNFFGDSKGFLDNFKKGLKSNLDEAKDKSDTEKYLDFMRETRDMGGDAMFGGYGGGGFKEVAEGLAYGRLPSQTQQMLIEGKDGKEGLFNLRGAIGGGIKGFMAGGPAGALGGAAIGGFT